MPPFTSLGDGKSYSTGVNSLNNNIVVKIKKRPGPAGVKEREKKAAADEQLANLWGKKFLVRIYGNRGWSASSLSAQTQ